MNPISWKIRPMFFSLNPDFHICCGLMHLKACLAIPCSFYSKAVTMSYMVTAYAMSSTGKVNMADLQ